MGELMEATGQSGYREKTFSASDGSMSLTGDQLDHKAKANYQDHLKAEGARQAKKEELDAVYDGVEEQDNSRVRVAVETVKATKAALEQERRWILAEPVRTSTDAEKLAEKLRAIEGKEHALDAALPIIEEASGGRITVEKLALKPKKDSLENDLSSLDDRAKGAVYNGQFDLKRFNDGYKQMAVEEAQAAGVEVNYPPYTQPKPQTEQPPASPQPDVAPPTLES